MKIFFTLFFLVAFELANAQQLIFDNRYGRTNFIDITSDGGYITSGWDGTHAGGDYTLSKLDANGNVLWTKTNNRFDGTYFNNYIYHVRENSDHTFLLTGEIQDSLFLSYSYIIKTDNNGNKIWEKMFSLNPRGVFSSIEEPGNISLIVGPSFYFLRINSTGDSIESKIIAFPGYYAYNMNEPIFSAGNGYIWSVEVRDTSNKSSIMIFKIDAALNLQWSTLISDSINLELVDSKLDGNKINLALWSFSHSGMNYSKIISVDTTGIISDSIQMPFNLAASCFGDDEKIFHTTYNNNSDSICFAVNNFSGNLYWSGCYPTTESGDSYGPGFSLFDKSCNSFLYLNTAAIADGGGSYILKIADTTLSTFVSEIPKNDFEFDINQTEIGISISVVCSKKRKDLSLIIYNSLGELLKKENISTESTTFITSENKNPLLHLLLVECENKIVLRKKVVF